MHTGGAPRPVAHLLGSLRRGLKKCLSNQVPGDAETDAAGAAGLAWGPHFEDLEPVTHVAWEVGDASISLTTEV